MWLSVMLEGMSCSPLMDLLGCCPKYLLHPVGIAVLEHIWLDCRRDQIHASEEASTCMSDGSFLKCLSYRTPYKHEFSTLLNLNAVFLKKMYRFSTLWFVFKIRINAPELSGLFLNRDLILFLKNTRAISEIAELTDHRHRGKEELHQAGALRLLTPPSPHTPFQNYNLWTGQFNK